MNWWRRRFLQRNISWIARLCHAKGHHTPKFRKENFHK